MADFDKYKLRCNAPIARAEAAEARVRELEGHLGEWGEAIMRAHPYDDVEFNRMSDYWKAAVGIATKRREGK